MIADLIKQAKQLAHAECVNYHHYQYIIEQSFNKHLTDLILKECQKALRPSFGQAYDAIYDAFDYPEKHLFDASKTFGISD